MSENKNIHADIKKNTDTGNNTGTGTITTEKIPDWKLERFVLGELAQSELDAISKLEKADSCLHERIECLRKSNTESLEKYPLKRMIREAAAAKTKTASAVYKPQNRFSLFDSWNRVPRWAGPAFAFGLMLLILPLYKFTATPPSSPGSLAFFPEKTRIKGIESRLEVWRKTGAAAEKLETEAGVSQGDVIQLRYLVPTVCYGTIVSLDGRGVVTVHLSGESGKAAQLTPGRIVALNHSYQLDDAPKFEVFYLVTSQKSFDVNAITQSIQKIKNPELLPVLPDGQKITVFTLRKVTADSFITNHDA